MRYLLLVLVSLCAGGLLAADNWNRLLFSPTLDVDLQFRTGRKTVGGWVHSLGAFANYRQTIVFNEDFSLGVGARCGFEQWLGLDPAPRRFLLGAVFDLGIDNQFEGSYWKWPRKPSAREPERYHKFPIARSHLMSLHISGGVDLVKLQGFSKHVSGRGDPVPEIGLRPWAAVAIGFFLVSFEGGYSATLAFGRGEMDHEAWVHLGVGRPYSPFSGHVGYDYQTTCRFAAHYFSMGFQAAF
ncbi:MAG: hypothetical protein KDB90_15780 [Planctomycetes bacterium]|nr:hypothetical protein [Planctomycetota bacterium]